MLQSEEDVLIFYCDNALAIEFGVPRPVFSGDLEDSEVFAGQNYSPLLDIEASNKL